MIEMLENKWSDWLDCNQQVLLEIPEKPGVYMMHAAMKILLIGGSHNMKKSISEALEQKCVSKATRIRFREEENFEEIRKEMITDYKKRHEGNIPQCMN
ncbi:hypothetical protein [Nitrosopumilus sp.]|uniref:hypothetical protein n=1 Tax=Nitrosopumilus sp. TaxID=2024843 RepID=UPI00261649A5|nr:hypothetical protein [Nitrosopumilus sp.]